ncbi:MAG: hypothetical protein AAF085_12485, partial [Planctomycetota bacterium]
MTALSITHPDTTAPVSIDWANYLPIDEAAPKLNITKGRLRSKAPSIAAKGFAVKAQGPGQSRPGWWISRQYDSRLWRGKAGEKQQPYDLAVMTGKNRDL